MKCSIEVRCIVCRLVFCCKDCRWNHENKEHGLAYDCPICRGRRFLCRPQQLNQQFIQHLTEEHLPLQCKKCDKIFNIMEDLHDIDKCVSVSELIDKIEVDSETYRKVDDHFNMLFDKANSDDYEAIVSVNKSSKTAVITPVVRRQHLVDYESSDTEDEEKTPKGMKTPLTQMCPKTPRSKYIPIQMNRRAATPHVKKLLRLTSQNAFDVDDIEDNIEEENLDSQPATDVTPSRNENNAIPETSDATTPTTHLPHLMKVAQAVTTSTPTHPAAAGWSMFQGQGADSPLSEIENTGSESTVNEPSKSQSMILPKKLKSIIMTGSRLRLGSQDSTEKQDSVNTEPSSAKIKRVQFAQDTVFEAESKVKRVFRKPKRMLTPGPQKPKYSCNPRFQALINRFENHGMTMARTPVNKNRAMDDATPPVSSTNMPARAINFKEDSPVVDLENYSKESNELFRSCVESPIETRVISNAITALSANIAGSLQNCLTSVLKTTDDETEIQFKFTITKKKVSVKRIVEDGERIDEKSSEIERGPEPNKENIWMTVAKAVRNVFWGDQGPSDSTTPHRPQDSSTSSASKRKRWEMLDPISSPINHKRYKYMGRISGRPPLRPKTWVSGLKSSLSAEHHSIKESLDGEVNNSWGLPAFMCDIYIAMDVTSSTSSIFNLVAISVDRYIAVTQPIKYAKHKNNTRVWLTIVVVWLISAAIGAPIVLGLNDTPDRNYDECLFNSQNYVIYSSLGSFYIPCIMMMFLYYSIFKALRMRAMKQRAAKRPPVADHNAGGVATAVVIENVAQTRQLAETVLHEMPTNTGSGSNEDDHYDSYDKSVLEADVDECHVIHNDKSTEFMLATVTEETDNACRGKSKHVPDPNGNNDSGYAPSNLEDTIREQISPPGSPALKDATVLRNMGCDGNRWKKNGKDNRNVSLTVHADDDDMKSSQFDLHDGSTTKKERKASSATARFTIYKANKASKKKREKSSAKKERKATKTLAIVLGVFLFCWAPFFTCNVLDALCGKLGLPYSPGVTVFILTTWLGYINSFLNPVIYTIFNPEFRKAFRKILRCT